MSYKRKRRKNADDDIRKLERASQSGQVEDIAKYWLACLRAGILPNYTLIEHYSDGAPYGVWMLEPAKGPHDLEVPSIRDAVHSVYYKEYKGKGASRYYGWAVSDFYGGGYHSDDEEDVKNWLRFMMIKYGIGEAHHNPARKRNPDESLRKLERLANQGDILDKLNYFRAAWQADEQPNHDPIDLLAPDTIASHPDIIKVKGNFYRPLHFVIFPNGWAILGYADSIIGPGLQWAIYKPMDKYSQKADVVVETPIGNWVDTTWRELAHKEGQKQGRGRVVNTLWDIEERQKVTIENLFYAMRNLKTPHQNVRAFVNRYDENWKPGK